MNYQILRIKVAAKRLGVSPATLWRRIKEDNTFPRVIKLGSTPHSAIGILQHELEDWLNKPTQQRQQKKVEGENK